MCVCVGGIAALTRDSAKGLLSSQSTSRQQLLGSSEAGEVFSAQHEALFVLLLPSSSLQLTELVPLE